MPVSSNIVSETPSHNPTEKPMNQTPLTNVREYGEGAEVILAPETEIGRLCIVATNAGGHNCTSVDLLDLLAWLRANRPDLLS